MSKFFVSLASLLCLCISFIGTAQASILDFEGLTNSSAEELIQNNQGYGGLTWSRDWYLFSSNSYPVPTLSGEYGIVNNFGVDPVVATSAPTYFTGVSIIGWYFNAPTQVGIRGFDSSNNLVGDTGFVGINTSTYTYLAAGWGNVAKLEFYGGQYYALDDMEFGSNGTIPEPGSLLVWGVLGLAGVGLTNRRRKS